MCFSDPALDLLKPEQQLSNAAARPPLLSDVLDSASSTLQNSRKDAQAFTIQARVLKS